MNVVFLVGRLGSDIQEIQTSGRGQMFTANLATNRSVKNKEGVYTEVTDWHELLLFGHVGKYAHMKFSKGSQMTVSGRIEYKDYLTKTGEKRIQTRIIVEDVK